MSDRWRTLVVLLTMSVAGAVTSCARDDDAAGPAATTPATTAGPVTSRPAAPAPAMTSDPVTTRRPSTTQPATTTPSATTDVPGITVPVDRRRELEEAGLGWMLEVEYPAQPVGVPWPTAAWPTGPLPVGVDRAA